MMVFHAWRGGVLANVCKGCHRVTDGKNGCCLTANKRVMDANPGRCRARTNGDASEEGRGEDLLPGGVFSSVTSVTNQCLRAFLRFSKRNKRSFVTLCKVGFTQCLSMLLRLLRLRFFG